MTTSNKAPADAKGGKNPKIGEKVKVGKSLIMTTSLSQAGPAPGPEDTTKPVAILVSHGMGQQIPFATLAQVAEQMRGRDDMAIGKPVVRHVRFLNPDSGEKMWLPRAEIKLAGPNGAVRTVHVYETYWAPLTEGNISLPQVIRFMATAGVRGVAHGIKNYQWRQRAATQFHRWMFGASYSFAIPKRTPLGLLGLLLLVLALVVINTIMTLVAGANLLDFLPAAAKTPHLVNSLTADLGALLLVVAPAYFCLLYSMRTSEKISRLYRTLQGYTAGKLLAQLTRLQRRNRRVNRLAWGLLGLACVALVAGAVLMAVHYFRFTADTPVTTSTLWTGLLPSSISDILHKGRVLLIGIVWSLTIGISLVLRGFLVQYMGDVAIYIDSHKVDAFHRVREEVKDKTIQTACAIYGARVSGEHAAPFAYERILMVGHSLGSVVAYDALNATLHLDESSGGTLGVATRTGGLITFGSPLDKTAYLFQTQAARQLMRPPLSASVQPLLRDVGVRKAIHWVNIYSPNDIISGHLDFYDLPTPKNGEKKPWAIVNVIDPDATTPVAAHQQYWNNLLLINSLRERVFANASTVPLALVEA